MTTSQQIAPPMRLFLRCSNCAEIRLMNDPGDTHDPLCDPCVELLADDYAIAQEEAEERVRG